MVLVHATFVYLELSFTCTVDDPSATAAEHDSGHHPPEHRPG
jgi:hypothetical protein